MSEFQIQKKSEPLVRSENGRRHRDDHHRENRRLLGRQTLKSVEDVEQTDTHYGRSNCWRCLSLLERWTSVNVHRTDGEHVGRTNARRPSGRDDVLLQ